MKKTILKIFLLILIFSNHISAQQKDLWTTFTTADGLAGNDVRAILESSDGALWFGTYGGGVSRYGEGTWTTFTRADGLADNNVRAILESSDGALWFGTYSGGVSRYREGTWTTFTTADGLADNDIRAILESSDGALWFGTYGGGVSRYQEGTWTIFSTADGLANNCVRAILESNDGALWFGTYGGGVSRYGEGTWTAFSTADGLADNDVWAILESNDGALWFGTYGGGVSRYREGIWTAFTTADGLADNDVLAILESNDGALWFGTYGGGVSRYREGIWTTFSTADGLADNDVLAILESNDGALWFGTYGGGVSRYREGIWTTFTTADGLADNDVLAILESSDGALWFGTYGGGVSRYGEGTWTSFSTADGLANNYVRTILESSDAALWFGTYGGGVSRYGEGTWTSFSTADGLANNDVRAILESNDGALWFGTYAGVSRYQEGIWTTFSTADGLADNDVRAILESNDGALWFGTYAGVSRYREGTWTTFTMVDGLADNDVLAILESSDGALWFGTYAGGVSRYREGTWTTFTTADGLADNYVQEILESSFNILWFGTNAGVTKVIPDKSPPNTHIIDGPRNVIGTSTPLFVLKGKDNFTEYDQLFFSYAVMGSSAVPNEYEWSPYEKKLTIQSSPLKNGSYIFYARSKDKWGNVDPSPATRTFKVDITTPMTIINYPQNDDIISGEIAIKGSVYDKSPLWDFDYFSLFYGKGKSIEEVTEWINFAKNVKKEVRDDTLALWNTFGLQGTYQLRLFAKDTLGHESEDIITVHIVDKIQEVQKQQGGYIRAENIEIYFPPNSIPENKQIQIINVMELGEDTTNIIPETSLGFVYDIEPKDLQLSKPGVLTITYTDGNLTNQNRLSILRYNENNKTWDLVGGTVDKAQHKISTSINQLGRYGLFEYSGDDAKLAVSDVNCQPRIFSPKGGGYDTRVSISFKLGKSTQVTIKVYNAAGRLAKIIKQNETFSPGNNVVYWDGRDEWGEFCVSGLYIVIIEAGDKRGTKTFMVLNE